MFITLANSFMTATRMDAFAQAGIGSGGGTGRRRRRHARTFKTRALAARTLATRAFAGLKRLAGQDG